MIIMNDNALQATWRLCCLAACYLATQLMEWSGTLQPTLYIATVSSPTVRQQDLCTSVMSALDDAHDCYRAAGYVAFVLFGSSLPGKPAYAVEWHTLVETWNCSINFFYVNQILNWLGIHIIESVAVSLLSILWP